MRNAAFLLLLAPAIVAADVRLPALLSDHALLQQDRPIHVWGWADPGEKVSASMAGDSATAEADADGRFSLYLPPRETGGPFRLTVKGDNELRIEDVLVGDVWVGSGQSNMAWTVANSNDAEREIAAADYPEIRIFKVKLTTSAQPLEDVEGEWTAVTPDVIGPLSAVGYFFVRSLHQHLDKPVGLIQSAWGGTPAAAWTPRRSFDEDPALHGALERWREVIDEHPRATARHQAALESWKVEAERARKAGRKAPNRPRAPRGPNHHHQPATLYNAMIHPLIGYAIRGAIWYQGEHEANQETAYEYRRLFRTMIEEWRNRWGVGDFPFLFVQLANYGRVPETSQWPELREAQTLALGLRSTGMAVTIDIGNPQDIHPRNKQDVGHRLALAARAVAYGEGELTYSGPLYRQAVAEAGGSALRVWFEQVGGGLVLKSGSGGFELAGADGVFHAAGAKVDGDSLIISSSKVPRPIAVRYGWSASPEAALFNLDGLPASPFRSDDWK